jgi:cytochrome P450
MARDEFAYVEYANADRVAIEDSFRAMGKENPRKDFLSYLLHAKDPQTGKGFEKQELDADSSLLISAGADTTSVTLSAAFFYLLKNPRVLTKLTAEVRGAFEDVEEIRGGAKLNGVLYLRACIDETLRLAPPVPTHLPREVLKGGLQIDGEFFPERTAVGMSAYCISHKEEYYLRAWEFQRWPSFGRMERLNDRYLGLSLPHFGFAISGRFYQRHRLETRNEGEGPAPNLALLGKDLCSCW